MTKPLEMVAILGGHLEISGLRNTLVGEEENCVLEEAHLGFFEKREESCSRIQHSAAMTRQSTTAQKARIAGKNQTIIAARKAMARISNMVASRIGDQFSSPEDHHCNNYFSLVSSMPKAFQPSFTDFLNARSSSLFSWEGFFS